MGLEVTCLVTAILTGHKRTERLVPLSRIDGK